MRGVDVILLHEVDMAIELEQCNIKNLTTHIVM